MNPILLNPKIESDKSPAEQLQQMKSYLFQFKEQIELLLMNIDSDNMSEKFQDDFSQIVGSKIMNGKEMSQILQSAGIIKLQVEELGGTVSALTVTTNGIYNQINDPEDGILTELSLISGQISAAVKFGVNYSGFNITASKLHLFTTGALQIDSGNFKVSSNGDVEVTGEVKATSGNIGNLLIDNGWLSYKPNSTTYPVISYDSADTVIQFGSNSFSSRFIGSDVDIVCGSNYISVNNLSGDMRIHSSNGIVIDGEISYDDGQGSNNMYWQKLIDVDPDDYVITNKAG